MYVLRSSDTHDPRLSPDLSGTLRRAARRLGPLLALGFALVTGVASLGGCREQKLGPEEVLRAFLADVAADRADAAWAALTEATKKDLEERHHALARAAGKPSDPRPARVLFDELDLVRLNQPETIAVVSPLGYDVTLRVTVKDGKSADIHLVREGTTWKIDLLGSLRPAPGLEGGRVGAKKEAEPTEDGHIRREETDTATTP